MAFSEFKNINKNSNIWCKYKKKNCWKNSQNCWKYKKKIKKSFDSLICKV